MCVDILQLKMVGRVKEDDAKDSLTLSLFLSFSLVQSFSTFDAVERNTRALAS